MKVTVSGLDLTRRKPRQPGGLPRSATTSHTDARQGLEAVVSSPRPTVINHAC